MASCDRELPGSRSLISPSASVRPILVPFEREQLAKPEAGAQCSEEQRVPVRAQGLHRFEEPLGLLPGEELDGLLPRIPENKPTEPRGWIALDEAIFERVAQDRPCSGEDVAQAPARWARKAVGSRPSTPSKAPVQPQPSRPPPGQECHPWLGRFRTLDDVSLALQV